MRAALAAAVGTEVLGATRVAGGDLNEAWQASLADGRTVFVKTRAGAAPGGYAREAAGLAWLGEAPGGLPVPSVVAVTDELLALEWIDPGPLDEEALGRGLAATHAAGVTERGQDPFGHPLRFGSVVLANEPAASWAEFYAERRLRPLLRQGAGRLDAATVAAVERVADRMPLLAGPEEPPARLHGDLWAGNVHGGADGRVYLVDPAAHAGHREVDLAMLKLFGGPSERAHAAYAELAPLSDGAAERVGLWQLARCSSTRCSSAAATPREPVPWLCATPSAAASRSSRRYGGDANLVR